MNTKKRFNWLRDRNNVPVACIVSESDLVTGTVKFAVTSHNPKDQFSKVVGRGVAEEMFAKGRTLSTKLEGNPKLNILKVIARRGVAGPTNGFSTRAINAARYRVGEYSKQLSVRSYSHSRFDRMNFPLREALQTMTFGEKYGNCTTPHARLR